MIAKVFTPPDRVFFLFLSLLAYSGIVAQSGPVNSKKGLALQGYDAVSYFQEKPLKGSSEISTEFEGHRYLFSSAENKSLFEANPKKYLPQYGGYCAYAMALKGSKVPINPTTYEIRGDKLYLFYNKGKNNTLEFWLKQGPQELVSQADDHWKAHLK